MPRGPLVLLMLPSCWTSVEQEKVPSKYGGREAIVVGAGLFDGEG